MPEKNSLDNEFIQKLKDIIDVNLENEKFGVIELASEIGLSRSQLHRRLKDINKKSTSQFIREYRLEKAMEMLKRNQGTASEIAYRVGFTSPTYFNTSFHNFYGYPPGEVKFQRAITPPKKTFSKKIIAIIPVIFLIGLIVFNETRNKESVDIAKLEKTIAVLPFVNNSTNEENMYFCNGIMAGIRDHLAKIPEFYVVSRLSVEPYRNTSYPLKVIAKELDVNFILEGNVQRIGNRAIISAELINVKDNKVLWSERYDKNVSEVFAVQANVIESISKNLKTIISPNLKTGLAAIPTSDTLAYDHYLKGEEYRFKANRSIQKREVWLDLLNKAKLSYELAVERDSTFVQSYLGLSYIIYAKKNFYGFLDDTHSDQDFMMLIDKTLQLDPNLASAYSLKANYYYVILNDKDTAQIYLEKAIDLAPNDAYALSMLMSIYEANFNYGMAVSMLKKMEKLARSETEKLEVYHNYIYYYMFIEAYDMCEYYFNKISEIDSSYTFLRVWFYIISNQIDKGITYLEEKCPKDSHMRGALLGEAYLQIENNNKALEYFNAWHKQVKADGYAHDGSILHYYGYGRALIKEGQKEKGLEMFNKQVEIFENIIKSKQRINPAVYYISIGLYTSLGQYEKAYESIDKFEEVNGWIFSHYTIHATTASWLDIIRDDPYFKASFTRGEKQFEDIQNQIRPHLPLTPPTKTD